MGHVKTIRATASLCSALTLVGCASALTWSPKPQPERTRVEATEALAAPEGGDALVGEYEFKEGGQVFANGQQVK